MSRRLNTSKTISAPLCISQRLIRSLGDIIGVIRDSADVIEIPKPVYNYKGSE